MPNRVAAMVPEREALLAAMPDYVPSLNALAAKLVTLLPGNADGALATHQALLNVFDPDTGEPLALIQLRRSLSALASPLAVADDLSADWNGGGHNATAPVCR